MSDLSEIDIETEVLDDDERTSVLNSSLALLKKLDTCKACKGGWNIKESIWPARSDSKAKAKLILLPLSRLGAQEGLSGSRVMIGYFEDADPQSRLLSSRPMVVKIAAPGPDRDKLNDENKNADKVRLFAAYTKHRFAIPVHIDRATSATGNKHTVLWSPFSSNSWMWRDFRIDKKSRLALAVYDLAKRLTQETGIPNEIHLTPKESIEEVFKLLLPFHLANGFASRVETTYGKEYEWYLRRYPKAWGEKWEQIWGRGETEELGHKGISPLTVIERLRDYPVSLHAGAIHGDLHPHNIVFSETGSPHVIDFGWAQKDAHIAKDFVLLECNIRFVWLPAEVPISALETMTDWLRFSDAGPTTGNADCDNHIALAETIRGIARNRFLDVKDWDEEYVIPFFIVAFGLLSHLGDFKNQVAARLTVFKLAQYIHQEILEKRPI